MASSEMHASRAVFDPPRLAGQFAIVGGGGSASGDSFDDALLAASGAIRAFATTHGHLHANPNVVPSVGSYLGMASTIRDACSSWAEAPVVGATGIELLAYALCLELISSF